ncbi:MAG: metal ABC transporter permease [Armatimonadetes bacterium]|nr:metal ABC transporter permease [Armatimonadota bacterium]NIM23177.1 metal ABC transporter permease [Armatimonadota bacterium]NIM67045.1 metal ABC transporter permease [Armatimonadota bacterium]NIM75579.1 metal ABC transporter permease [Armatimonadota bacterium]NIN05234.1 metal ABC transporter permease [Armatimonadota bacterium]
MSDILQYGFMQRALIAGAVIGVICAVVGVYVVLRGMAFIGAGIAHASFGGVALGVLLGINPVVAALVFCLIIAWGIGILARKGEVREDISIGVFFAATMALGILVIGLTKGYQVDLFGYLFGSILAVTPQDLWISLILGAVVLSVVGLFFKDLLFITFDSEMAEVAGLPAERLHFVLLGLISLTVVLSMKVVGIILVSALIITPAAAAYQLTEDFRKMMALAVLIGVLAATLGLLLSYWLNTASGATIVLLATFFFLASVALSPRRLRWFFKAR